MDITDEELAELEQLVTWKMLEDLKHTSPAANPNFAFLKDAIETKKYRGVALEGSSRSGKTWAGVDIIFLICLFLENRCTINIYRETYNEFKTTLYDDFKRRLDDYNMPNPFHNAKEVQSFKINNSTIHFLGDGKHGGGCDYAFYNEIMFIKNSVFDQSEMRCRKFWWADYNPSVTDHWFFDKVLKRPDVGFLRTTYEDNKFISDPERNKIMGYNPWKPESYIIKDGLPMCYNAITGKVELITESNQPPPHPENVVNGTADEFMHKVYALGLRGAMKGVIFQHVTWIEIDEMPIDLHKIYGNDFGFTVDSNSLVRYAEDENNIFIEPLCYQPIESPKDLGEFFNSIGIIKNSSDDKEDGDLIICDSSDKYTGENKGTVEMVKDLRMQKFRAKKVSKTKSIMYWLNSMKEKKIHIVKNHLYDVILKEQQNYRMKEIGGIAINQPIDAYNHFWDSARYTHIAYNSQSQNFTTDKETIKKINY